MRTDAEVMDVPRATADAVGCYFSERRGLISMKNSRRRDAKRNTALPCAKRKRNVS